MEGIIVILIVTAQAPAFKAYLAERKAKKDAERKEKKKTAKEAA